MKTIGNRTFPTTLEEAEVWRPKIRRRMLHSQVMAIAKTRIEGMWAAYAFPVPGINHDDEEYLWRTEGVKLPAAVARVMFPDFAELPYAK